jgi:signal transduction histidine kinase
MDAMNDDAELETRTLTISARTQAEEVEIAVQDSGPGLPPEARDQVLRPFFTTKPDGLGLGLSISQSIVEAHGGRLWVTPNAGRGVTFHFTLPIAAPAAAPEPVAEALSLDAA